MCGFAQPLSTPQAKGFLMLGSALSSKPENKQQQNNLNNASLPDPRINSPQPQTTQMSSDPYLGRTSPKFNFRSSPFAIQSGPNQEQSDSGLNLA